jgi:hypothetical protein
MAAKGESRTGLVVFLVLFILIAITLGVTTYYGYDAADKATKDKQEADKSAKAWENDSNWNRYLANTYLAYMGEKSPEGPELGAMRTQYGSGSGAKDQAKAGQHKAIIDKLDKEKKWNDGLKKPNQTLQDEIDQLKKSVADLTKKSTDATEEARKANEQLASANRELEAAKADYLNKLAERKKQDEAEQEKLRTTITSLQKQLDEKGQVALKELVPLQDENKKLRADNKKLGKDLTDAVATIKQRGWDVAREAANQEFDVSKMAPENLAKIVTINGAGDMPYISIGSADNLRRGVTFGIYGKGADGKPLKQPKGRLEVVRVTGEHLAQARITDLKDERSDPVMVGDFLYNPAWNSNLKQHVAIIGTIDLTGDGQDSIQEFMRNLKNQNVEIDAWMDMKTKKLNGSITRQTDLLIVGAYPDFGVGVVKSDDPVTEAKNQTVKEMQRVQDEAEKLGVRVVRLNAFLEMSGYALPKLMGTEKDRLDFHRSLPAVGSPVDRRDREAPAPKK